MRRLIPLIVVLAVPLAASSHAAPGGRLSEPPEKGHAAPRASTPEVRRAKPERAAAPDARQDAHQPVAPGASKPAPVAPIPTRPAADEREESDAGAITADRALALLEEGNSRWVNDRSSNPNIGSERRDTLAARGQKPFATILTCADSRLPVERIFDRGVGDLFVVRVAGAIAGTSECGTIEYGAEHLGTPLLVVMGHTKCGAVAAAASGADAHGNIARVVESITPAVDRARRNNPGLDDKSLVAAAIKENVWQTVYDLFKASPSCRRMAQGGELRVVGAVCDIATGQIEWLGEHPWQTELLDALAAREAAVTDAATPRH